MSWVGSVASCLKRYPEYWVCVKVMVRLRLGVKVLGKGLTMMKYVEQLLDFPSRSLRHAQLPWPHDHFCGYFNSLRLKNILREYISKKFSYVWCGRVCGV